LNSDEEKERDAKKEEEAVKLAAKLAEEKAAKEPEIIY